MVWSSIIRVSLRELLAVCKAMEMNSLLNQKTSLRDSQLLDGYVNVMTFNILLETVEYIGQT